MERERYYKLEVYGRTWEGWRGVYSYTIPAPINTDAEANRAAADFANVIDWRLVECRHSYENPKTGLYRRIDEYRTLRGFRNGMTPQRFYRLANGV